MALPASGPASRCRPSGRACGGRAPRWPPTSVSPRPASSSSCSSSRCPRCSSPSGACRRSARARHAAGRGDGGGERARAQLRGRRRHRRQDEAHRPTAARAGPGAAAARAGVRPRARPAQRGVAGVHHQPAGGGPLGRGDRVLRARLHAAAQAPHLAEHRVGRRGGLHAGRHRVGRGHRHRRLARARHVRRDLLLDAAALLGARHALPRRLRGRGRADAPRGGGAPRR